MPKVKNKGTTVEQHTIAIKFAVQCNKKVLDRFLNRINTLLIGYGIFNYSIIDDTDIEFSPKEDDIEESEG